jgi:hypothetical protein
MSAGISCPPPALAEAVVAGLPGVLGTQTVLRPLARRRNADFQNLVAAAIGLGTISDTVILDWGDSLISALLGGPRVSGSGSAS